MVTGPLLPMAAGVVWSLLPSQAEPVAVQGRHTAGEWKRKKKERGKGSGIKKIIR